MNKAITIPQKDRELLAMDLVRALVACKNTQDAAFFLQDLLTRKEMEMLSKRLGIAKSLVEGKTYDEIESKLKVSHATIAKVAVWLEEKGEGFRSVISTLSKDNAVNNDDQYFNWNKFKRKHALYFWPELLLEEIVKSANNRQRRRIKNVLDRLDEKSEIHKRIEEYLNAKV
jgi:TrpR-related protein YerC/YecD